MKMKNGQEFTAMHAAKATHASLYYKAWEYLQLQPEAIRDAVNILIIDQRESDLYEFIRTLQNGKKKKEVLAALEREKETEKEARKLATEDFRKSIISVLRAEEEASR